MKRFYTILSFLTFLTIGAFAFAQSEPSEQQNSEPQATEANEFVDNLAGFRGHRFVEIRGAMPVYPTLTTHGFVQSFVAGFSDGLNSAYSNGADYDSITPQFATDLNLTIYPPIANYRWGFMLGAAIDTWDSTTKRKDGLKVKETIKMNYYYIGAHADYGHWVFNDIGTRLSIYGEISVGWLNYVDSEDSDMTFCLDICPFGIQFCPEKHIGIFFEIPHFGGRPFFETGVSIGF